MTDLKSNVEWKQWGKTDPLFGVASWANKQKDGASPWTEEEFYALGELDWRDFQKHWQQYGMELQSCLEIGCGAGRITKQLACTFDRVFAADISEDMIRCAQKAVGTNVEFSVIDGINLPQPDGSVKAVFSTHVLQHLDNPDIGHTYFREFYRVLDDGGTLMVHLPVYQFPGKMAERPLRLVYSIIKRLDDMRANAKRRMGVKLMRGTSYPIPTLYGFLADLGFKNIEFRIFPTQSTGGLHSFVFATK